MSDNIIPVPVVAKVSCAAYRERIRALEAERDRLLDLVGNAIALVEEAQDMYGAGRVDTDWLSDARAALQEALQEARDD